MGKSYRYPSLKMAMGLMESGMKNTESARDMRERYLVSPQKTALAVTIANRERGFSKISIMKMVTVFMWEFLSAQVSVCTVLSVPIHWKNGVNM